MASYVEKGNQKFLVEELLKNFTAKMFLDFEKIHLRKTPL